MKKIQKALSTKRALHVDNYFHKNPNIEIRISKTEISNDPFEYITQRLCIYSRITPLGPGF